MVGAAAEVARGPDGAAIRCTDQVVRDLVAAARDTIDGVIFYGSRLHDAGPGVASAVDLVVVVSDYHAFYHALQAAGALHRSGTTLALLSRVLPPNSIAFRAGGDCAKCLVVNRADLAAALRPRRRDHLLLARLLQSVDVIHTRAPAAATWLSDQLDAARGDVLEWLAPYLDETFDSEHAARRMLEVCYRAELRPEAEDRAGVVFEAQREFLSSRMTRVLEAAAEAGLLTPALTPGHFRLARTVSRTHRIRVRAYFLWSNARITARWFKHVITFHDWLPYIAAKVERRTGRPVELTERERRWPFIFLWPRVIRTLRARPPREGVENVPTAGLRDTVSFMRQPAAFTAGAGLRIGDFYRVRVPGHRLYVVTDPPLVEEILVAHQHCFGKSRIYWSELRRSFGASMGSLDGEMWLRLHAEQRPFFTPRAVQDYLPTVERLTTEHLERLAGHIEGQPLVSVWDTFAELNARLVLHLLFGRQEEPEALPIAHRIADGHSLIAWNSRFPWRPLLARINGRARQGRSHKAFFRRYAAELGRSAAASDPKLLLSALVRLCQAGEAGATGPARAAGAVADLSPELLANEVTFHLGASTETQAAAEAWAVHLLWRHPEVLRRLRDEIDTATGGLPVGVGHLPALSYCRQIVQEVLRLYPPVHAVLRDCVSQVELTRHNARPRESFMISLYAMHRSPRLWDAPERFRPDRFAPGRGSKLSRHQYLPFGAGRHVCIGQHLALPAMVLVVARFAQSFDWHFDAKVEPVADPSLKPPASLTMAVSRRP